MVNWILLHTMHTYPLDATTATARGERMTNAQHAIDILRQALDKIDKDLDPTYQITEAIKFCEAAEDDVKMWRNKYLMKISEPVK